MSHQHLDRLSAVDVGFLAQEGPTTHMHIGGLILLDGPPPPFESILDHVGSRLHLVPRYRQKLATPPLQSGLPLWVDDPSFNLGYHVRHSALPPPRDEASLLRLASRVFSQPLDRGKPLWELWVVEAVEDDSGEPRFALVSKSHHALVDGLAGIDILGALFDLDPAGRPDPRAAAWVPHPEPSPAELTARGLVGTARRLAGVATAAAGEVADPRRLVARTRDVAEGIGEVARTALQPPSPTPFNVPPGPHRRIAVVRAELSELKAIKDALGGTVNDVVLAVVAGGLAHFLRARGEEPAEKELKACVPVSVRSAAHRRSLGNAITVMMAPLPVEIADPVARLQRVREVMDGLKDSKQALGASALADAQDLTPPGLVAQASRLQFSARMYNLLVTNVPGPQLPLYLLGRRMRSVIPIPFLAGDRALAVAILSYDGKMDFGLLGDYDALPDLDQVAEGIEGALGELREAARRAVRTEQRKAKRRTPAKRPARPARRPAPS